MQEGPFITDADPERLASIRALYRLIGLPDPICLSPEEAEQATPSPIAKVPQKPYYEKDGIVLFHGKSEAFMSVWGGVNFDLCLTDPPYGLNIAAKPQGSSSTKRVTPMLLGSWDKERVSGLLINQLRELSSRQIIWGGNYFSDLLPPSRQWLVWYKRSEAAGKTTFADAELAWCSWDGNVRVLKHEWNGFRRQGNEKRLPHPTQKPLGLMHWCLDRAGAGVRTVFDPFCGSGTTLVAAKERGLIAVGIEMDERYCEIAARRLSQDSFGFMEGR